MSTQAAQVRRLLPAAALAAATLTLAACASTGGPRLDVGVAQSYYVAYFSPSNGDGVQDELSVPVGVEAATRRVIQGYRITVFDRGSTSLRRA